MTFPLEYPPLRSLSEIHAAGQSCGLRCKHRVPNAMRCELCVAEGHYTYAIPLDTEKLIAWEHNFRHGHLDNPAASFRDEDK